MKNFKFEVTQGFKSLLAVYGFNGITDLDIGEECAEHNIFYKHLEAWFYDEELQELEIYVD